MSDEFFRKKLDQKEWLSKIESGEAIPFISPQSFKEMKLEKYYRNLGAIAENKRWLSIIRKERLDKLFTEDFEARIEELEKVKA